MPIAKVQLPDGRIGRFEVPEGTTPEQVLAFAEQQFAAASAPAPTAEPSMTDRASAAVQSAGQALGQAGRRMEAETNALAAELDAAAAARYPNLSQVPGVGMTAARLLTPNQPQMLGPDLLSTAEAAGTMVGNLARSSMADIMQRPAETAGLIAGGLPLVRMVGAAGMLARGGTSFLAGRAGAEADVAAGVREEATPMAQTAMEAFLPEPMVRALYRVGAYVLPRGSMGLTRQTVDDVIVQNLDTQAVEAEKRLFPGQERLTVAQRTAGRVGAEETDAAADMVGEIMSRNQQSYYAKFLDDNNRVLSQKILSTTPGGKPVVDFNNFRESLATTLLSKDPASPGLEQILRFQANESENALARIAGTSATKAQSGAFEAAPVVAWFNANKGRVDAVLGTKEADKMASFVNRLPANLTPRQMYTVQTKVEEVLGAADSGSALLNRQASADQPGLRDVMKQVFEATYKTQKDTPAGEYALAAVQSLDAKRTLANLTNMKAYKALKEGGVKDIKPLLRDYDKFQELKQLTGMFYSKRQLRGAAEAIDPLDLAIRQDLYDIVTGGGRTVTASGMDKALKAYDERVLRETLGTDAVDDLKAVLDFTRAQEGIIPGVGATNTGRLVSAVRGVRPGDPDQTARALVDVAVSKATGFVPATGMRWLLLRQFRKFTGTTDKELFKAAMQSSIGKKFAMTRLDDPAAYQLYTMFAREAGLKPILTEEMFLEETLAAEKMGTTNE